MDRRPLKTRGRQWAARLARALAERRIRPNTISILGLLFALNAASLFLIARRVDEDRIIASCLVLVAICIQLRLLCNMLDGLVAVEGGLRTKTGDLFNEVPDRVADVAILLAAGCFVGGDGVTLGWTASLLAVLTAYIRLLGGALGFAQDFRGPMAKPHRMAALTAGSLIAAVATYFDRDREVIAATLLVIIIGAVITLVRRLAHLVREVER